MTWLSGIGLAHVVEISAMVLAGILKLLVSKVANTVSQN
jgi:hypothetical protein